MYICACVYICISVCLYTCMHRYVYMYIYIFVYMYVLTNSVCSVRFQFLDFGIENRLIYFNSVFLIPFGRKFSISSRFNNKPLLQ